MAVDSYHKNKEPFQPEDDASQLENESETRDEMLPPYNADELEKKMTEFNQPLSKQVVELVANKHRTIVTEYEQEYGEVIGTLSEQSQIRILFNQVGWNEAHCVQVWRDGLGRDTVDGVPVEEYFDAGKHLEDEGQSVQSVPADEKQNEEVGSNAPKEDDELDDLDEDDSNGSGVTVLTTSDDSSSEDDRVQTANLITAVAVGGALTDDDKPRKQSAAETVVPELLVDEYEIYINRFKGEINDIGTLPGRREELRSRIARDYCENKFKLPRGFKLEKVTRGTMDAYQAEIIRLLCALPLLTEDTVEDRVPIELAELSLMGEVGKEPEGTLARSRLEAMVSALEEYAAYDAEQRASLHEKLADAA